MDHAVQHTEASFSPAHGGEPLRVAFFAGSLKPGQDGVTRVLYRLMDAANRAGIRSLYFSPILPEGDTQPARMEGVASVPFPCNSEYRWSLPDMRRLESTLRAFSPDVMHIHSPCSLGYAAVRLGRRLDIPVVATYHTHFASYARYYRIPAFEPAGWLYLKNLYGRCRRVYVPSRPILHELEQRGFSNLRYLPHGVDTTVFHPRFRSEEWRASIRSGAKAILLFAGRLVWEKDLETLIGVYDRLRRRRADWVLVLAGDGPIRREVQAAMPEARFLGHLSGEDLSVAYASSDIFVFPSTTETFGNVTLEAMASGIPPICVREGGAWGIIKDGATGYVTAPREPREIVARIEFLLDHPAARLELAARALAFSRTMSWDKVCQELFADYVEIVREGTRRPAGRGWKAA